MWKVEKLVSKGDYNYAVVRNHPNRTKNDYVLHHRVIVENALGRLLTENEIVHHKNHKTKDNRRKNLVVLDKRTHARLHAFERGRKWVKLKCPVCKTFFNKKANNTHLYKPSKYDCTCCSRECRGRLSAKIQHTGMTKKLRRRIKKNVVKTYRKYRVISP